MRITRIRSAVVVLLSFALSACVVYPKKVEYYDSDCRIDARRLELETGVLISDVCSGGGGSEVEGACLAALLAVGAGSAIVSGSIVVVGNTVYWLEKKGRCLARSSS
ncbi:MAG: hypothetical protein OEW21_07590 [Betaproteobacteria bacterium]|nr:hypothetical protein [Betaproteobacteria bacterium]